MALLGVFMISVCVFAVRMLCMACQGFPGHDVSAPVIERVVLDHGAQIVGPLPAEGGEHAAILIELSDPSSSLVCFEATMPA